MAQKVTMFFNLVSGVRTYGFSETHYHLNATTHDQAESDAIRLCNKRLAICGRGVKMIGMRISNPDRQKDSFVYTPKGFTGGNTKLDYASPAWDGKGTEFGTDFANLSLMMRFAASASQYKNIYLCGLPDGCFVNDTGGGDYTFDPILKDAVKSYLSEIRIGTWGFRARRQGVGDDARDYGPKFIRNVSLMGGAGTRVGIEINAADDVFSNDQTVQVKAVKLNNRAFPGTAGMWKIHSKDPITDTRPNPILYLARSEGIDPANISEPGTVERVAYVYLPYTVTQTQRTVSRKRGVGGLTPVGRSRRRAA